MKNLESCHCQLMTIISKKITDIMEINSWLWNLWRCGKSSGESLCYLVLTVRLNVHHVAAKFVPWLLTKEQKKIFTKKNIVTCNEIWVYGCVMEMNTQSSDNTKKSTSCSNTNKVFNHVDCLLTGGSVVYEDTGKMHEQCKELFWRRETISTCKLPNFLTGSLFFHGQTLYFLYASTDPTYQHSVTGVN